MFHSRCILSTVTPLTHPNEGLSQDAENPQTSLAAPMYSVTSGTPPTQSSQSRLAAPTGQELSPKQTTAGWSSAYLVFQEEKEYNSTLRKKKSLSSHLWISCSNICFTLLPGNHSSARARICATSVSSRTTLKRFSPPPGLHSRQFTGRFSAVLGTRREAWEGSTSVTNPAQQR